MTFQPCKVKLRLAALGLNNPVQLSKQQLGYHLIPWVILHSKGLALGAI